MITTLTLALLLQSGVVMAQTIQTPGPADRARALLAKMDLLDKIGMLHGVTSPGYTGSTSPNVPLGIPALTLNDGRQGFRPNDGSNTETAFPCQLAVVSTFDVELMYAFGTAMGEEFKGKGANVVSFCLYVRVGTGKFAGAPRNIGPCPDVDISKGPRR